MLIARAPFRISLAGGGTDLEPYYARYGGVVVSATVNKYFYVVLSRTADDAVQITSSDFRVFERRPPGQELSPDGDLGYLKTILQDFGVRRAVSVFTASEILPGTGLGSSSTVAVALVKALATLCQRQATKQEIAELAAYLEIVKLGRPIGLQDHFAASFGGLNCIEFGPDRTRVTPLRLPLEVRRKLETRILLFFTGLSRSASTILAEQHRSTAAADRRVIRNLHGIKGDAIEVRKALVEGRLCRVGEILHESWQRKKELAGGVTNERIDCLYQLALGRGAVGGKVAGAGGGGFLLLYCEPDYQEAVTTALEEEGLNRLGFHFDDGGAQVLVNSMAEVPGISYPQGQWTVTGTAFARASS